MFEGQDGKPAHICGGIQSTRIAARGHRHDGPLLLIRRRHAVLFFGDLVALVVRDAYSTLGAVYPAPSKSTDETTMALRAFVGDSKVKRVYSDNADELLSASRSRGVPHEASQRGMSQTKGIIEREVQDMLIGTRTLLVAAGLPGCFWSHAAPCYMHLDNSPAHPKLGQSARA